MHHLRFHILERSISLRPRPVGIGVYTVNEAIRGVIPPGEWDYPEHMEWFDGFVLRLHGRFVRFLSDEQRQLIRNLSGRPLEDLHSYHLDPQVAFAPERYLPNPDLNMATYLRRAYGLGAVREICQAVRETTLSDPQEMICYSVGGIFRVLDAIW